MILCRLRTFMGAVVDLELEDRGERCSGADHAATYTLFGTEARLGCPICYRQWPEPAERRVTSDSGILPLVIEPVPEHTGAWPRASVPLEVRGLYKAGINRERDELLQLRQHCERLSARVDTLEGLVGLSAYPVEEDWRGRQHG